MRADTGQLLIKAPDPYQKILDSVQLATDPYQSGLDSFTIATESLTRALSYLSRLTIDPSDTIRASDFGLTVGKDKEESGRESTEKTDKISETDEEDDTEQSSSGENTGETQP